MHGAGPDREVRPGRNDIDVIGKERAAIGGFGHGHRGMFGQQFGQQALMGRVEVLDQDKGHPRFRREQRHQLGGCLQAAGRRADGDDRQRSGGRACCQNRHAFRGLGGSHGGLAGPVMPIRRIGFFLCHKRT